MLETGMTVPNKLGPISEEDDFSLSDLNGRSLVLFFYPRDDTSGCTKEAIGFSEAMKAFEKANTLVIGVSKDSLKSHAKFAQKHNITVPLISDEHGSLCEDFGVWVEKSMYGKTFMGIVRTTFLINADGAIKRVWNKVKVPGHVDEVLNTVSGL